MHTGSGAIDAALKKHLESNKHLPILPPGAPRLITNLADEDINYAKLVSAIELFPSIAGRLVAMANSPWSAPAGEITSLHMACTRLGFSVVKSASIAMAIAAPFDPLRCEHFDPVYYWSRAFMTAEASALLHQYVQDGSQYDEATLRTAGLLHNLGQLVLADRMPRELNAILKQKKEGEIQSMRQAMLMRFGFHDTHAGHFLARSWALPEVLVAVIAHYAEPDYGGKFWQEARFVGIASKIVSALQQSEQVNVTSRQLEKCAISENAVQNTCSNLLQQEEKIKELAVLFN